MAHARAADLRDIADVLEAIRALPGVLERSPGIFYLGRHPFLHFHTRTGARWADARDGADWGPEISLPFESRDRVKALFVKEVHRRHQACTSARHAAAGRVGRSRAG